MKKKRLIRKSDVILLIVFLAAIVFLQGWLWLYKSEQGDVITIYSDGKLFGNYNLAIDQVIEISNSYGFNTLTIKDHKAYVSDTNCGNQDCRKLGQISNKGESIICIPHKVIISIEQKDGEPEYDSMVY